VQLHGKRPGNNRAVEHFRAAGDPTADVRQGARVAAVVQGAPLQAGQDRLDALEPLRPALARVIHDLRDAVEKTTVIAGGQRPRAHVGSTL
jgi:hypothetical protein